MTPSPPMTLSNMRQNGVKAVLVWCATCDHHADVAVDHLSGDLEVPALARRFRCSACGSRQVQVRPAWHTKAGLPAR